MPQIVKLHASETQVCRALASRPDETPRVSVEERMT